MSVQMLSLLPPVIAGWLNTTFFEVTKIKNISDISVFLKIIFQKIGIIKLSLLE